MFAMVAESLSSVAPDGAPSRGSDDLHAFMVARDQQVDLLCAELEEIVQWQLARQQPMGRDLRMLLTAVHIAPELERSHDLVVHVARHVATLDTVPMSTSTRAYLEAMASEAAAMWRSVSSAYQDRDPGSAAALDRRDSSLDELQQAVITGLGLDDIDPSHAVALALLARFYERLGDHAVHLANRIRYLALGDE